MCGMRMITNEHVRNAMLRGAPFALRVDELVEAGLSAARGEYPGLGENTLRRQLRRLAESIRRQRLEASAETLMKLVAARLWPNGLPEGRDDHFLATELLRAFVVDVPLPSARLGYLRTRRQTEYARLAAQRVAELRAEETPTLVPALAGEGAAVRQA